MNAVMLALALLSPIALGGALLRALGLRASGDRLAFAATSTLTGYLALALLLWMWVVLRLPLERTAILGVVLGLSALSWRCARWFHASPWQEPERTPEPGRAGALCFGAVGVVVAWHLLDAILSANATWPVLYGDEVNNWGIRAQLLYVHGGATPAFASDLASGRYALTPDYPLLNPLLQLWIYVAADAITLAENRLPLQLLFLALFALAASALRRHAGPWLGALLLLSLATTEIGTKLAGQALADPLLALGLLSAYDTWLRARRSGERRWWILVALGLACCAWSKREGTIAAVIFGVALLAGEPSLRAALRRSVWLVPAFLVIAASNLWNLACGVHGNHAFDDSAGRSFTARFRELAPQRWPELAEMLGRDLLLDATSFHLLPLLVLSIALAFPRKLGGVELRAPLLAFGAIAALQAVVLLAHPSPLSFHREVAFPRLVFQLLPVLALWLAVALEQLAPGHAAPREEPGSASR
ncbi:MAG: hypothetical protein JNM84_18635 [Planctomycetes bacterium]|nr:hypothetical protein [Planctomycetota bacterium]